MCSINNDMGQDNYNKLTSRTKPRDLCQLDTQNKFKIFYHMGIRNNNCD